MWKSSWTNLLVVLIVSSHTVQCANILALFSSPSFSDHLVFRGYVSQLVQKGHSVVMMTPYPGNFGYPDVERIVELDVGQETGLYWQEWLKLVTNKDDLYTKLGALNELSVKLAIAQLRSKQMTALFINPNIKFDLVVTEADVPVLYAAADKYKAPHISITTSSGKIHQHEAKGNPIHPLLYPDVNALNYHNLTRWQKLVEFYRHVQTKRDYYDHYLPLCELAAQKILGLKRDLLEVENDIDLLFVAASPLLIGRRPSVPAVIYTDRLHIKPGVPLFEDLQLILDKATNGVIYFSLGAVQESDKLAPVLLQTLAEAFRELPFTVLWKIGNATMIDTGKNIIVRQWYPQQEILAHPNVKAFITHGGPRSLEEAVFYKVPIIGLPIVKSRKVFMREITRHGTGEILDPYNLNKAALVDTVTLVATDKKYKQAMVSLHDAVVEDNISGPEKAVWWTEYLLRHGGARHLRSPAVGLTTVQYYMIDYLCMLLIGLLVVIFASIFILRVIVRRLYAKFLRRRRAGEEGKFKAL